MRTLRALTCAIRTMVRSLTYQRRGQWLATGVAGAALAVYLITLAPGLTFEHHAADGGDLIAAARTLGIPHPTGYPSYTLLAWLFSHLPIGAIAYRVNFLSALCAAVAVGLCCRTTQVLLPAEPHAQLISAAAGLTLAFSPLFWSQAVISEVYALQALFSALLLWLIVRWWKDGGNGLLWLASLTLGLGLGNHLTLIFALPAILVLLWPKRHRWLRFQVVLPAAACFAVGLSIYAYLPLAARHHPAVNWGNPQTWDRFLWMVTAKQYQPFLFGLALDEIPNRLSQWARILGEQFGWWGLGLALAGGWRWRQREPGFTLCTLSWTLPLGLYAFFYDTTDSHVYLLPAILLLALWWAKGARYLLQLAGRRQIAVILIILLPLVSIVMHWERNNLSGDYTVHHYINQVMQRAAPESVIIVRGDRPTFALWYAVYAEQQRSDVSVVSGPLLAYIWYRDHVGQLYPHLAVPEPTSADASTDDLVRDLVRHNLRDRPIYATDPSEAWQVWFDFVQEGDISLYRIRTRGK